MNINSNEVFINLHLNKLSKHKFSHEITNRVTSMNKTVGNCYFSDLTESALKQLFSKKPKQIALNQPVTQTKMKATKKLQYYLKAAPDKMLISPMLKSPSLLTASEQSQRRISDNTHKPLFSTPKRLFKGSQSASGLSNSLRGFYTSTRSKKAGKPASLLIRNKRRKISDSSSEGGAMVFSPVFTPLKKKFQLDKRIDFYKQFDLFKRKPRQFAPNRRALSDKSDTMVYQNRIKSSKTMRRIEELDVKFPIEKGDGVGLMSERNHSPSLVDLRSFKLDRQKEVMRELENLIDYSEAQKDYQEDLIERIRNSKRQMLISKINNKMISDNLQYYEEQYLRKNE